MLRQRNSTRENKQSNNNINNNSSYIKSSSIIPNNNDQQQQQSKLYYSSKRHDHDHHSKKSSLSLLLIRILYDYISLLLICIGLIIFTSSFFLAKRSLSYHSLHSDRITLLKDYIQLNNNEITFLIDSNTISSNDNNIDNNIDNLTTKTNSTNSAWMKKRYVDSIVFMVVDALRFDFAYYHLPLSIGSRLSSTTSNNNNHNNNNNSRNSRLYQFVADPPTVTMQRLKALTSGGLPTFADISSNFGGGIIEEDTWINQLLLLQQQQQKQHKQHNEEKEQQNETTNNANNTNITTASIAFVGDDTWLDLFPNAFRISYPYPSFNTRDIDTVDNGCLHHLPDLLKMIKKKKKKKTKKRQNNNDNINNNNDNNNDTTIDGVLDVLIVHFLGVDHVGHTYGPNNYHMDLKLHQMDVELNNVIMTLENTNGTNNNDETDNNSNETDPSCHMIMILGDHGMTPDGNHGGGTVEEVNAALFVHSTHGCYHDDDNDNESSNYMMEEQVSSSSSSSSNKQMKNKKDYMNQLLPSSWNVINPEQFIAIHQIDLVPTISILLGIPIPYGNLGCIIPNIIPKLTLSSRDTATSLAYNAGQVYRYYIMYSKKANHLLPRLNKLNNTLYIAIESYKHAIQLDQQQYDHDHNRSFDIMDINDQYIESASLFKVFLADALDLGQQVWTRFDTVGMTIGICIMIVGLILYSIGTISIQNYYYHTVIYIWKVIQSSLVTIRSHDEISPTNVDERSLTTNQLLERYIAFVFIIFQCVMLTFSNSYILAEQHSSMYCLTILSAVVGIRLLYDTEVSSQTSKPINNNNHIEEEKEDIQQQESEQSTVPTLLQQKVTTAPSAPSTKVVAKTNDVKKDGIPLWIGMLLLPILSRLHELLVTGHGLDPSIRKSSHWVHHELIFVSCCILLVLSRWMLYYYCHDHVYNIQQNIVVDSFIQSILDCISIFILTLGWLEKRNLDPNRNVYIYCQISFGILLLGIIILIISYSIRRKENLSNTSNNRQTAVPSFILTIAIKLLIAIMMFTGPSTASSMVLYSMQTFIMYQLSKCQLHVTLPSPNSNHKGQSTSFKSVDIIKPSLNDASISPFVIATLWKFITRHAFFSTNHGCYFNRLQYSSAFVMQNDFDFVLGGISLSINTFGWEIVGLLLMWLFSHCYDECTQQKTQQKSKLIIMESIKTTPSQHTSSFQTEESSIRYNHHYLIWRIYCIFQYLEATCSCISVSVLRRHLMVWDIYAPHFLFTVCFTMLNLIFQLIIGLFVNNFWQHHASHASNK